jgi:hypothetical protein
VTATPQTSNAGATWAAVGGVTNTGFTMHCYRTSSTGNVPCNWIAMAPS